jgi:WD40 repeat protein/serine/threonine protein kinase/DNA-binding XRE family transcriptional regulator/energy-coupling factor transporter ATP-binding protein EcfA2
MQEERSFGRWLKDLRKELDLKQAELAKCAKCATSTIQAIETGKRRPSKPTAELLAKCLGLKDEEQAIFLRMARAQPPGGDRVRRIQPPAPLDAHQAEEPDVKPIRGYELRERIGAGGFGEVYRAEQPGIGREVAVKVILPAYANHPEFIRRFEAEAQLIARLEHPYIVPLYDFWREPDGAYLVMRYMRGGSLQSALAGGPLPLDACSRTLDQLVAALAVAHRAGIVHRDLKPANVLLDEDGNAYLADFGIAKDLDHPDPDDPTAPGVVFGTPAYLAPEQIRDEPVTSRTDIYCLGVLLYECLTGAQPFADSPPAELLQKQLYEPLPPLQGRRPDLPPALDVVIQRATAKDPANRYPDVLSVAVDWQRTVATTEHRPPTAEDAIEAITPTDLGALENPYKGLRSFGEADVADFFGRETLTHRLLDRLAEEEDQRTGNRAPGAGEQVTDHGQLTTSRFLAVVGPSGSGKSSVVRAGLIPALRRGGLLGSEHWFVVELLPGAHPLEEIEAALLRVAVNPPQSLLEQLGVDERGLIRAVKRILPKDSEVELALVIDQFEELFTLVEDEAERVHVLNSLVTAVTDVRCRLRVIITLRADFYDRPLRYGPFGELMRGRTEVVLPLTAAELERAIVGPAERTGLALEPGLVTAIVKDVGEQPGALPLLQYALTELFERRAGRTLTLDAYQASGGVLGALARRADELYDRLDAEQQEAARQLFLRLVTPGEGIADTRRRALRSELTALTKDQGRKTEDADNADPSSSVLRSSAALDKVIDLYSRYRLLTFDHDPITRGPTIEVAHEALIRSWVRLREWLDTSRAMLRTQRQLTADTAEWVQRGRATDNLATGARLDQFESLANSPDLALNHDERAYVLASVAMREAEAAEVEAARLRELAQAEALAEERLRRAEEQQKLAEEQRRRAETQEALVREQQKLVEEQERRIAVEQQRAEEQRQRAETQEALVREQQKLVEEQERRIAVEQQRAEEQAKTTKWFRRLSGGLAGALAIAVVAMLLAIGQARISRARQLVAEAQAAVISRDLHLATLLALEANKIADGSADDLLADIPYQGPSTGDVLSGHADSVRSIAWSPPGDQPVSGGDGGGILVSGGDGGEIVIWNVATHTPTLTLPGSASSITSLAWSSNGNWLASASENQSKKGEITLWNIQPQPETGGVTVKKMASLSWEAAIKSVAWSSEGWLASGSEDGCVAIWDIEKQQAVKQFCEKARVTSVSWSAAGSLAWGSTDGSVIIWDKDTGQVKTRFAIQTEVNTIAWLSDQNLAAGSANGDVMIWNHALDQPSNAPADIILKEHTAPITHLAWSAAGGLASAAADKDKRIILWNLETRQPAAIYSYSGYSPNVVPTSLAWSPNGGLSTGYSDGQIVLWHKDTGRTASALHQKSAGRVVWSPDGRQLAVGGKDNNVLIWDTHTETQTVTLPMASGLPARFLRDCDRSNPFFSGGIRSVAWSPDNRLAAGLDDRRVLVWDAKLSKSRLLPHAAAVKSVAWSSDGRLASAAQDGTVIIWRLGGEPEITVTVEITLTVPGKYSKELNSLAWSPNNKYLAAGSEYGDDIIIWDLATRQPERQPLSIPDAKTHAHRVTSVAWSPVDDRLAIGLDDLERKSLPFDVGDREAFYEAVQEYKQLGAIGDDVLIWDRQESKVIKILSRGHFGRVNSVAWSPDGKSLASGADDSDVLVWNVETGGHTRLAGSATRGKPFSVISSQRTGLVATPGHGHAGCVLSVAWRDDVHLASSSSDGRAVIWNLATQLPIVLEGHQGSVSSVAWSPDGRLATGSQDTTVIIWNEQGRQLGGRLLSEASVGSGTVKITSLTWSNSGLAAGADNGAISVWNMQTYKPISPTLQGHLDRDNMAPITGVAWSGNDEDDRLASSSTSLAHPQVIVWDQTKGTPAISFTLNWEPTSIAWSHAGHLATGDQDGTVSVWYRERLATGYQTSTVNLEPSVKFPDKAHRGLKYSIAWLSDELIASAGGDDRITIWNVATGQLSTTLRTHGSAITALASSTDGYLAAIDADGCDPYNSVLDDNSVLDGHVFIWQKGNLAAPVAMLQGHKGCVNSVAWSSDGRLASVGADGVIRILPAPLTRAPCQWLLRNLTKEEWQDHLRIDLRLGFLDDLWLVPGYSPTCLNLASPSNVYTSMTIIGNSLWLFLYVLVSLGLLGVIAILYMLRVRGNRIRAKR